MDNADKDGIVDPIPKTLVMTRALETLVGIWVEVAMMDGVDVRTTIGIDKMMLGNEMEGNGSVKGSEKEMGDPIVSPTERTRRNENTWAIKGDENKEMIMEVEGTDIGSENGGGRDDGSCEILGESLTSTTSVTGAA
ncbi:hypothetical protein KI387_022204, partial [Taxus chinensis]